MLKKRKGKKIIVNALSISRILGALLMPLFFNILSIPGLIIVLIILFLTDTFDGILARYWKVQTRGGALLDPLGDKLLAVSFMFSFIKGQIILLIPFIFEITITLINVNRTLHREEFETSIFGKIKTWLLFITLALCAVNILKPELLNNIINVNIDLTINKKIVIIATLITIFAQIVTISSYIRDSIRQKSKRCDKVPKLMNTKDALKRLFDEDAYLEDRDKPLIDIIREK